MCWNLVQTALLFVLWPTIPCLPRCHRPTERRREGCCYWFRSRLIQVFCYPIQSDLSAVTSQMWFSCSVLILFQQDTWEQSGSVLRMPRLRIETILGLHRDLAVWNQNILPECFCNYCFKQNDLWQPACISNTLFRPRLTKNRIELAVKSCESLARRLKPPGVNNYDDSAKPHVESQRWFLCFWCLSSTIPQCTPAPAAPVAYFCRCSASGLSGFTVSRRDVWSASYPEDWRPMWLERRNRLFWTDCKDKDTPVMVVWLVQWVDKKGPRLTFHPVNLVSTMGRIGWCLFMGINRIILYFWVFWSCEFNSGTFCCHVLSRWQIWSKPVALQFLHQEKSCVNTINPNILPPSL